MDVNRNNQIKHTTKPSTNTGIETGHSHTVISSYQNCNDKKACVYDMFKTK